MKPIYRVSIIGTNEISREGLRRILEDDGVEVCCVSELNCSKLCQSETFNDGKIHIALCLTATGNETISTIHSIRQNLPESRIVAVVDEFSVENVAAAFGEGVDGYVVNGISCDALIGVLRLVALGEKVLPSKLSMMLSAPVWKLPAANWKFTNDLSLSAREIEILRCLMEGDCNKIIARRLDISEATVKVHVKAVLRKLHVSNRTQAAIWAFTRGLGQEDRRTVQQEFEYQREARAHTRPLLRVAS